MLPSTLLPRRLGRLLKTSSSCCFSTTPQEPKEKASQQHNPFQRIFEIGEWDPARTNPLYRPKYPGSPRIIHADDFARRPKVSLTCEFDNMEEGMVILSWMDDAQQKNIYKMYVDMMLKSERDNERTSHEFVVRVISQKVRLTEERVAAVIQLQHNEQQMKRDGVELLDDLQEFMDKGINAEITAAYSIQRGGKGVTRKPPPTFVEDPVGVTGVKDTKRYVHIDDLVQVDEKMENEAEFERAKHILDTYKYIEDRDDDTIPIPLNKQCRNLLQSHAKLPNPDEDEIVLAQREKGRAAAPKYPETQANGTKRPRWKFIAQVIDSREEPFQMNSVKNTLVEHDGTLRAGTVADVKTVAWKPKRHEKEFTYAGVKKAWLDRVNRNIIDGWGYAREKPVVEEQKEDEENNEDSKETTELSGEEQAATDESSKPAEKKADDQSAGDDKDTPEPKK